MKSVGGLRALNDDIRKADDGHHFYMSFFMVNVSCLIKYVFLLSSFIEKLTHLLLSSTTSNILHTLFVFLNFNFIELPETKLHSLLLDHKEIKLTWVVDWNKREVLFNVDEAFTADSKWFSFGFSKRGALSGSDICFFVREQSDQDDIFQSAIVSYAC